MSVACWDGNTLGYAKPEQPVAAYEPNQGTAADKKAFRELDKRRV